MLKGIKTQLYPTVKQKIYIDNLLGSYRFVYNKCLEYKINEYTLNNKSIGLKDLGQFVHQNLRKNPEFAWLNEHNSKVLFQAPLDMLDAYKNFFVNHTGFPKFKSKKDIQSCRFPIDAISKKGVVGNKITLTKQLKKLKIACSDRDLETLQNTKIKSATITKEKTDLYFCSFLVDVPVEKIPEPTNFAVGIDLGIKTYAVIRSDNQTEEITNPKFIRSNEKKLRKLNQGLSKTQKGSKNREKARQKLAKFHYKVECQKEWFIHSLTTSLVKENEVIGIEDLNVSGMLKNPNLARSIQELSAYQFKRQLLYKSVKWNRKLIQIDRFYPSSKLCSNCGWKNKDLKLSDRIFKCQTCGLEISRDDNASINIRNEAIRIYNLIYIGKSSPEFKPVGEDVRPNQLAGEANFVESGRNL